MINDPKTIRGWTIFDWANSTYSLIISSAIFPAYYVAVAPDYIEVFGKEVEKNVLASYSISISFLIVVLLSPILSGIADYSSSKKTFMRWFSHLGAISCMLMVFFTSSSIWLGILLSMLASIGYTGSLVFYNAFLPEIASKDKQDSVSARGYIMGYIGSVILMFLCLIFIELNNQLDLGLGSWPVRLSFLAVGIWWFAFSEYSLKFLHDKPKPQPYPKPTAQYYFRNGLQTLKDAFHNIKKIPLLSDFLGSFFFYNMGVQTIMYMAVYFASSELEMKESALILTILLIQILGIVGAWFFSYLSDRIGNFTSLIIIIVIWVCICIGAYYTYTSTQFYFLASTVGLVMGGVQSQSRSTYSKHIPVEDDENTSFFSFYDVTEKMGTVIGTMSYGLVASTMGGFRSSALALMVYFIIGLLLLVRTRYKNHVR